MTATKGLSRATLSRATLTVKIVVRGPVITRSSSIGEAGVDAPMACTRIGKDDPRFYLPGRLVKGLLRDAWNELGTVEERYRTNIASWLGLESPENSEDEPKRGRLSFGDFVDFDTSSGVHALRFRIQIDETTGTAGNAMLQIIDSPYAPQYEVTFQGEIRWLAEPGSDPGEMEDAILRGLSWIQAVGGARTSGFGQVVQVTGKLDIQAAEQPKEPLESDRWDLRLTFREPLILAKRKISDNLFESDDVLPGGALKGAVAEMMARQPEAFAELRAELHKVRFTHAFPTSKEGDRPHRLPLSIAQFPGDDPDEPDFHDLIQTKDVAEAHKAANKGPHKGALKFDIDWKDKTRTKALDRIGWPKVPTELRVRTAIDSSLRKAKESALFAWQMLVPYEHEWVGTVDVSGLTDKARRQLEALIRFGIEPLGKTKSRAHTELTKAPASTVKPQPYYIVVLQTPALLLNPEPLTGSSSALDLEEQYQLSWSDLSGNSLKMTNYFQRCSLAGGRYFQKRFQYRQDRYRPYLLCDEGSAFLLEPVAGQEEQAQAALQRWANRGLPLPAAVRGFYQLPPVESSEDWRLCPYLPENGYGEVAVNGKTDFPLLNED